MFWKWFKMLFVDRPITPKEIDEVIRKAIEPFREEIRFDSIKSIRRGFGPGIIRKK